MQKFLVFLFLACTILFPPISIGGIFPTLRLEFLVALVSFPFFEIKLPLSIRIVNLLLWFILSSLISIVASYTIHKVPYDVKDFMIIPMVITYLIIVIFGYFSVQKVGFNFILNTAYFFIIIAGIIGVCQTLDLFRINDLLTPLYTIEENTKTALLNNTEYSRAVGTVGDPRHFAMLMSFGFSIAVVKIFKNNLLQRIISVVCIFFILVVIFNTASRTGLLVCILIVILSILYSGIGLIKIVRIIIPLLIIIPIGFYYVENIVSENQIERILDTNSDSYSNSFDARQRDNFKGFEIISNNPIVFFTGLGPAKSVLPGSEHSDIGWMLIRFGMPGLIIYIFCIYSFYINSYKLRKHSNWNNQNKVIGHFGILIFISWSIFIFAESVFKLSQLMSFILVFCGIISFQMQAMKSSKELI